MVGVVVRVVVVGVRRWQRVRRIRGLGRWIREGVRRVLGGGRRWIRIGIRCWRRVMVVVVAVVVVSAVVVELAVVAVVVAAAVVVVAVFG